MSVKTYIVLNVFYRMICHFAHVQCQYLAITEIGHPTPVMPSYINTDWITTPIGCGKGADNINTKCSKRKTPGKMLDSNLRYCLR